MMTAEEAAEAAKGLTFEKVWVAILEISQQQAKISNQQAENFKQQEEVFRRYIDEMSKNADRRQAELSLRLDATWKKIEREQEETARRFKETERYIKRVLKNIGGLNNSVGKWVEKMVSANLWENSMILGMFLPRAVPANSLKTTMS
jgi:DNA anti-recombination protein RmuC